VSGSTSAVKGIQSKSGMEEEKEAATRRVKGSGWRGRSATRKSDVGDPRRVTKKRPAYVVSKRKGKDEEGGLPWDVVAHSEKNGKQTEESHELKGQSVESF